MITSKESRKKLYDILLYMMREQFPESTIESTVSLLGLIRPEVNKQKALIEMEDFIKTNPTEKQIIHEASEIYKKYRMD